MCQSQAEGGKRCAAHTRPRYTALMDAMEAQASKAPFGKDAKRKQVRNGFSMDEENALNIVANHASTTSGAKQVLEDIERFQSEGDSGTVAFLKSAYKKGEERAEIAKETTAAIRKAKEQIKRKVTRSSGVLTRSNKATPERNMQTVFPGVAKMWDTEKNGGILPTEVTPNVNKDIWLRCENGHSFSGRGNNVVAPIRNGKRYFPLCPECEGRKPRQFQATQEELTSLSEALGDNPEAFNALTPALQYSLMEKMGLLRGGEDGMSRNIAMSIVHGDLTLKDVMLAKDFSAVDGKLRDNLDDEEGLANISDIDINDSNDYTPAAAKVDQVLDSAGVLDLVDPDSELAANIQRENNEALWARATAEGVDIDEYVAYLETRRGQSVQGDAAIDRFKAELAAVQAMPLPEGYVTERFDKYGNPVTMTPTLSQRRFATLVEDRRRVMNWSGTGAGKTLSATLAVQSAGARETIVVCPKAVMDQWETEFKQGFPENTEVRMGLPAPGETLPPPPPGVNRVWIANYDKFQSDPDELHKSIGPLADRLDAVIYDEIHMAKASDEATTSLRRRALEKFTDRAGRANPDLVVIGASATPVVNNLEEAQSVLRLVEGPESKRFATKPTIKNAAAAYHRLAAAGVRHMPTYKTTLTRHDETVDVTDNVHKIQARINAERANSKTPNAPVHPAMMERALLPEKLPKIVAAVKANKGPSVVYTEYTTGMVDPMRKRFEDEGLRVGTYTGEEPESERKAALAKFRRGELDVLIGSKPIATGVDGLQHTSNNLVVASMPWTAALDDQLVGRFQRRGQSKDVNVTYVLTEAKAGGARWSWCKDNRQKRVRFKRDIANAAVDGVLPDGALDSKQHGADKALDALKSLTAALAKENSPAA